jgi:ketosteroid isomerase-like protein
VVTCRRRRASRIVRKRYDRWNDRDLDGALELAAEDVEVRLGALGQTLTGHEGFRRFMDPSPARLRT